MSAKPGSGRANCADGVCLIDDECGIVGGSERGEGRERGEVSVHAEERLRHQKAAACAGTEAAQVFLGGVELKVGIDGQFGARKAAAIDETGVNGTIGDDEILRAGQCGEHAEVGLVAGWKE